MLDTGYDANDDPFSTHWAQSRISAHQHDWSTNNNGIAGSEDNGHGSAVANILDLMNYNGGTYFIHQVNDFGDVRQALEDIQINHPGADVINVGSAVMVDYDNACDDEWDDILQDLVITQRTYVTSPVGNPITGYNPTVHYPASSTFVIGVGGAMDGNPWWLPGGGLYGWKTLSAANCPLQYNFHQARDGATSIFKPDVYGMYGFDVTPGSQWWGTSVASPQITSAVGDVAARYYLGKDPSWIPFKAWSATKLCWEGVYRLAWASAAPDGRNVTPAEASMRGDLANHYVFFNNPWTCYG